MIDNPHIQGAFLKAIGYLDESKKTVVSVSGGSDSDVVVDFLHQCGSTRYDPRRDQYDSWNRSFTSSVRNTIWIRKGVRTHNWIGGWSEMYRLYPLLFGL